MVTAGAFLPFGVPGTGLSIVHISTFPPFWTGAAARRATSLLFDDFLCKQASLLFIYGTFGCTAFGLWSAAVAAPGILCGGREKGRVAHGCCAFVVCLVLSFWPMR